MPRSVPSEIIAINSASRTRIPVGGANTAGVVLLVGDRVAAGEHVVHLVR
jgi:hypothetical protein